MPRCGLSLQRCVLRTLGVLAALAVLLAPPNLHGARADYLPSIKIGIAPLVSPSAADSYYGTSTTSTDGLGGITGSATPTPIEIAELARALKNDPDLIYQYVRNNIQTVWMYGLQKGALGASIDKSGTPFDQAELMVALLRQAGKPAKYVAGTIFFGTGGGSIADFTGWTGISDARAACQLLANGAIPGAVNGVSDADCSTIAAETPLTSVRMAHAWVRVTIAGGQVMGCAALDQCYFDPSFKTYTWKAGIPLATAMGFTAGDPLLHATSGSFSSGNKTGPYSSVPYAQSLNTTALNGDLQSYSSNLLAYIQNPSNHVQGGQMEDIIGGGVLVPSTVTTRQSVLPYADPSPPYTAHVWTTPTDPARYNAIPDQYRTTLKVKGIAQEYKESGTTQDATMFEPVLFVDEIYGRRLTVETNFAGAAFLSDDDQAGYYDQHACLALDAANWTTWATARCLLRYDYIPPHNQENTPMARSLPVKIELTANHPYAAADGTYMDATLTKDARLVTPLTIVHGWGDVSPALLAKWSDERFSDMTLPTLYTATHCRGYPDEEQELCLLTYEQPTGAFAREKAVAGWLAQFSKAARMNAQIASAATQVHHALGVMYADNTLEAVRKRPDDPKPGFVIPDNFDRIDVDAGISFSSRTSTPAAVAARRGALRAFAASAEMLEGSIAAQQSDLPDTSSTATRFEWGNTPDTDALQNPLHVGAQPFYAFTSTNVNNAYVTNARTGLVTVDGNVEHSCEGDLLPSWGVRPQVVLGQCYQLMSAVAAAAGRFTAGGFTVYASGESYLGPGQRGGVITPEFNTAGLPTKYLTDTGAQRGGALVALKNGDNDEPLEIAHVIVVGAGTTKGGGGGTQTDAKLTYDPATAADVLKTRFVDRSNALGVNLANGSLGMTSPVSIDTGNGGFPYQLSANLTWHPGTLPATFFSPASPIAPIPGWIHSWKNSLTLSGSGMEAMGESDIRAAIGAIVSFVAAQDIYQAQPSIAREVAGVLTQSWWSHQLSGNVVTVNVGGNARQFVKIATGGFVAPGPGYATLTQTGARVPYEETCFHQWVRPPFAQSRGWDVSGLSFDVKSAQGDVQHFGYFLNEYHTLSSAVLSSLCGKLKGFRMTSWTFPYGMTVTPTYTPVSDGTDTFDVLSAVSNGIGRSLSFSGSQIAADTRHIDFPSGMTLAPSMKDARGYTTTFTYRSSQAVSATQRPLPYALIATMTTPEHPGQPNVSYAYDGVNRVESVSDAVAIQQGTRGPYQFLIADGTRGERDDPLGQPYTVIYDTYGHPSRTIDEVGHETQSLFDSRGRALKYVYPEGDCEVFGYDNRNNTAELYRIDKTSSCSTAAGATHVLHAVATWDPDWNKPLTVTNFRGKVTTLDYYASGAGASLLHTATRPAIAEGTPVYQFAYDSKGKLTDATGPTGIVTHNVYDGSANLTSTVVDYATSGSHLNLTTAFGYDAAGNVTSTTDPKSNVTTSLYDANRRKCEDDHHDGSASAGLNAASRRLYDEIGRVTDEQAGTAFTATPTVCGGTGVSWLTTRHTTYTPTSKVATVTDADSRTTTTSYDDGDRVLTVTDPVGRKLHYRYCGAAVADCAANAIRTEYRGWQSGNACSVTGTDQQCYRRPAYTPNGRQKTLKDANGNTTSYTYDGFDRLTRTTFPDATYEQLTLDENANVTARRNRAGQTLSYAYNDLDWLAEKVSPSPAVTTDWTYLLDGRIDLLSDTAANTIDYGYDTAGRLNQVVTTVPGLAAKTVGYELDENGNRTKLTWPGSPTYYVGYCYDSLNRMTDATESATDCTSNPLAHYTYDPLSRRTNLAYAGTAGASMAYSYSNAGDLLTLNHAMVGTGDPQYTFAYTDAHQLKTETVNNSSFVWQPSTTGSTTYGTANNLNQYPTVAGVAQSYDSKGNLTSDGTYTFAYDTENRLLTACRPSPCTSPTMSTTYQYDPLGRRTKKSGTGVDTTFFLSDGTDEIAEYDASGSLTNRYVPGPGIDQTIVMIDVSNAKWFFHTNKQGSLIAATDATGARTAGPYIYDPNGNCFKGAQSCTAAALSTIPFKYAGRRLDPETGLYYYRARYYDPNKGRFLQTDPVGYAVDVNLYTYVRNDPVNATDPEGDCPPILHGCGADFSGIEGVNVTYSGIGSTADVRFTPDIGSLRDTGSRGASQQSSAAASVTAGRIADAIPQSSHSGWLDESSGMAIPINERTLFQWEPDFDSPYFATPEFRAAFEGSPAEVAVAATMSLIRVEAYPIREVRSGAELQLPGGPKKLYNVYSVGPPESPGPMRIAHVPGENAYYLSIYHYKPGPGVPHAYVKFGLY